MRETDNGKERRASLEWTVKETISAMILTWNMQETEFWAQHWERLRRQESKCKDPVESCDLA